VVPKSARVGAGRQRRPKGVPKALLRNGILAHDGTVLSSEGGFLNIRTFRTQMAFESWMRKNHLHERQVWLRIYKKNSGVPSITIAEALDVALCWGWIDGIRKAFDERSYLQRYTPRRAKSTWSQINRKHVARLTKAARMTLHGQRQVDAAKADGRWDSAYAPMRGALDDNFPEDLRKAIEASPRHGGRFSRWGCRISMHSRFAPPR
jgi:uncharacterized protein YdeI (YjbR/CyaY-like superfamily)